MTEKVTCQNDACRDLGDESEDEGGKGGCEPRLVNQITRHRSVIALTQSGPRPLQVSNRSTHFE